TAMERRIKRVPAIPLTFSAGIVPTRDIPAIIATLRRSQTSLGKRILNERNQPLMLPPPTMIPQAHPMPSWLAVAFQEFPVIGLSIPELQTIYATKKVPSPYITCLTARSQFTWAILLL